MARGYDETAPVRIWVGNIGRYNEGFLVGDWFSLPMDHKELWDGINEACKVDPFHEEVSCFDYECDMHGVTLSEYTPIDDFNALAATIEYEFQQNVDAAEAYIQNMQDADALEAANIILDADSISFCSYCYNNSWMSKEEKYGRTIIEELYPDFYKMLEEYGFTDCFDYEAYARGADDTLLEDGYLAAYGSSPDTDTYTALEILAMYDFYSEDDDDDNDDGDEEVA